MEKTIEIDGLRVNYNEVGPEGAPEVVLMHGWGCNHTTVASIENILSGKLHVYNIDLPGHGKSDEPKEVWGIEDYTRLIEKFIARLGIKRPILIGHSFGGRISILLSSRNDVSKVILVDSAGVKPKRDAKYYAKVYSYKLLKKIVLPIFGEEKGNRILEKYRKKRGSSDYANSTPMMRAILSRTVNEDLKWAMPSIKAPTLLIWGEDDTATPLSDAKTMEQLIPDSGLASFPGCGHYSFLDNPRGFRAVINSFLKDELK